MNGKTSGADVEQQQQQTPGTIATPLPPNEETILLATKSQEAARAAAASRPILILAIVYIILIALLFIVPILLPDDNSDGFTQAANVAGIVFLFGGLALVVSVVSLILTIRKRKELSMPFIILGIFPIVASMLIVLVIALLATPASSQTEGNGFPTECTETQDGNITCLTPKEYPN